MVFSSYTFLAFFLPAVLILHFIWKNPVWRNCVLTVASLFFYAWGEPRLVVLMLATIVLNYLCGLGMEKTRGKLRVLFLLLGIGISTGMLIYYKYEAFFANTVLELIGSTVRLAEQKLPIGISFYTFQIITYTVDVYRKKVPAQKSLLRLALYISFFPQLIAGPIVNYTYVEPQLQERTITADGALSGLRRFIIGLGKKLILANTLGSVVEQLDLTGEVSVLGAWVGAFAFTLQYYYDFSGYSDMAIGLGRIFGFDFPENFHNPYAADSISDFWRRWHISLGAFFRDYVYIPLGGSRVKTGRLVLNLMIVWSLTGLWHGASWNFIVWGTYFGVLLVLEKIVFAKALKRMPGVLRHALVLLLLVIGWVLFYHEDLGSGIGQIAAMFGIGAAAPSDGAAVCCLKQYWWTFAAGVLFSIPFDELALWKKAESGVLQSRGGYAVRTVWCIGIYALSMVFLAGSGFNPFLYFRF